MTTQRLTHFYNEFDPFAAEWIENLMISGEIPHGRLDTRSIVEIKADEIRDAVQSHFFAGITGWPLALRLAGWPSDRPIWTASLPCQPFSAAGKRRAQKDKRHLWPVFFDLVRKCRPGVIVGEQVPAAIGLGWLDGVFIDLETEGYACGAVVLPACGLGAPHIRARLYWIAERIGGLADAGGARIRGRLGGEGAAAAGEAQEEGLQRQRLRDDARDAGHADGARGLVDTGRVRGGAPGAPAAGSQDDARERGQTAVDHQRRGGAGGLADGNGERCYTRGTCGTQRQDVEQCCRYDGGMEHAEGDGRDQRRTVTSERSAVCRCGESGRRLADAHGAGPAAQPGDACQVCGLPKEERQPEHGAYVPGRSRGDGGLGLSKGVERPRGGDARGRRGGLADHGTLVDPWADSVLIPCSDGKWRRAGAGVFPLAHGLPRSVAALGPELGRLAQVAGLDGRSLKRAKGHRIGVLKGSGNAIVAALAAVFVRSYLDLLQDRAAIAELL